MGLFARRAAEFPCFTAAIVQRKGERRIQGKGESKGKGKPKGKGKSWSKGQNHGKGAWTSSKGKSKGLNPKEKRLPKGNPCNLSPTATSSATTTTAATPAPVHCHFCHLSQMACPATLRSVPDASHTRSTVPTHLRPPRGFSPGAMAVSLLLGSFLS
jgi:hypothetical protein